MKKPHRTRQNRFDACKIKFLTKGSQ